LNVVTHGRQPGTITVAEESTSWPAVSRPTFDGGLGFTYKWNMGWMHDMLAYMREDPVHRRWHHGQITFSMLYAFTENFVLPFSHDEVVYGKRSMLEKMPGDPWQQHASLRALYGYLFAHPGKKLMFMGAEFGQRNEWNHDTSLDWAHLEDPMHRGLQRWVRDLNAVYRHEPSLYQVDFDGGGFSWIDCHDADNSIVSLLRKSHQGADFTVAVINFTPVPRSGYVVGVPSSGPYREILNSDLAIYGGGDVHNAGAIVAAGPPAHGLDVSLRLTVPPLGFLLLKKS
jgi:1,4-alpha-glucan branching enzyme